MSENSKVSNCDVVIIGAGIGGLVSAAKLAKDGKKVIVIEQHSVVGGYATTFKRGKFIFEAGLHALDGIYDPNNPNLKIFEELDIMKELNFIRLPEFYSVIRNDLEFVVPDNVEDARTNLLKQFPDEEKAIDKYYKMLINLRKEILYFPSNKRDLLKIIPVMPFKYRTILRYLFSSLISFMDKLTDNEDLKLILSANTAYYNTDPKKYSLLHCGGAQGSFLSGGACYIEGGSKKLADHLENFIKKHGGEVLLNHKAQKIEFSSNKISSVTYCSVKGNGKDIEKKISTNFVVANANMPEIINKMLPEDKSKKLRKQYNNYKISHSGFALYLGLKKPLSTIGSKYYSSFILPDELKRLDQMVYHNDTNDFKEKIVIVVDYSLIPAKLTKNDEPTATVMVVDRLNNWENLSNEEYKAKKEEMSQVLIDALEKYLPGSRDLIEYYEAATPKTMARYTKNPEGCIYGYSQDVNQIGPKRPDIYSSIPGLYFAGAWTKPGAGISGVLKSGFVAAVEILKKI